MSDEQFVWEDSYKEVSEPEWLALVKTYPGRWLYITRPDAELGPLEAGRLVAKAKSYNNVEAQSVGTSGFFKFAVKARWLQGGDDR